MANSSMDNNPLNKFETDIRNLQSASRDIVGHAVEVAASAGLPDREIERVTRQTVEQGKWSGESREREYSGPTSR